MQSKTSSTASKGISSGEYDTYTDDTVTDGLRITFHSKYEAVTLLTDDLEAGSGLDSTIHSLVVDYVKSRILEDSNQFQEAQFFILKYDKDCCCPCAILLIESSVPLL